jgi:hypothetical protein
MPEIPYCPNASEETTGYDVVLSDLCAQSGNSDAGRTSNKTGKLEVSTKNMML